MNYKNIVLALVFLAVSGLFFVSTDQSARAACGTTLECQIAVILEQIKTLQAQLATLQNQEGQTQSWCYDFYTNFGIGTSNADFGALINVLDKENISEFVSFNRPALYNEVIAGAVVRLQAKYGILQTGYVGPITRAKLNALYGCQVVSVQPSVKIISPNGGETYNQNSSLNVTWATKGIMPLETIDLIRLRSYTTGLEYNLAYTVFNDGQETILIPSSVPAGSYLLEIKTYKNNILVFDASDSYFKISNNNTQSSITVTWPVGGEQWAQSSNQFIGWNINGITNAAIDIIGTNGQYRIASLPGLLSGSGSYSWTVGTTLSGTVMSAGQYRITIYDSANPTVQGFSNYFTITPSNIAPSVLSISSVAGLKPLYSPGEKISFSVKGVESDGSPASNVKGFNVQAYVCKNGNCNNYLAPNPTSSYNGNYNLTTGLWDVAMNAPSDSTALYSMRVVLYCSQTNSYCGSRYTNGPNDQVERLINFTVSSNIQPSITITSPNGGEVWKYGETRKVTWTSQGVSNVAIYVGNDTVYGSGSTNYLDPAGVSLSVPASQGYFDWNILQSWLPKTAYGNENRYKIRIVENSSYAGASDTSDNYFSIIAPDNTFVPWLQAKNLIETCGVKMVMQSHNLNVYLTLWDNTRVTSIEPSIDEVIRVTQNVTYKCGYVPIATE